MAKRDADGRGSQYQMAEKRFSPDPHRTILTIDEACNRVGVSRRTIYNWITAKKIEWFRTAGGSIRIYADTLFREKK